MQAILPHGLVLVPLSGRVVTEVVVVVAHWMRMADCVIKTPHTRINDVKVKLLYLLCIRYVQCMAIGIGIIHSFISHIPTSSFRLAQWCDQDDRKECHIITQQQQHGNALL